MADIKQMKLELFDRIKSLGRRRRPGVFAMSTTDDPIAAYAKSGGGLPSTGPIRDSFWAGVSRYRRCSPGCVTGSIQRRAYEAGQERAKVEPNLKS